MPLPSQRKGVPPQYVGSLVSGRNLSQYVGSSVGILARLKQHEEGNLLLMEAADGVDVVHTAKSVILMIELAIEVRVNGTEIRCRVREGSIPCQKWLHIVGEVQPELELHQHAENPLHITLPHEQPLDAHTVEEVTSLVTHPCLQHLFKGYKQR